MTVKGKPRRHLGSRCIQCGGPMPKRQWFFAACSRECLDAYAAEHAEMKTTNCAGCGKVIAVLGTRLYCTPSCRELHTVTRSGIADALRRKVFAKTGGKCAYCGDRAEHADHIKPFSKGGPTTEANLVAACQSCNYAAGDYLADDFESKRQYILRKRGLVGPKRASQAPSQTNDRPRWHAWIYGTTAEPTRINRKRTNG